MTPPNPYEVSGRLLKVNAIVEFLDLHNFTISEVLLMDDSGWLTVSKMAGVRPPSSETIRMVVETIQRRSATLDDLIASSVSPTGPTGPSGTGTTFEERLNAVADKLRAEDEANGTN